jgi:ribosomal protein S21
VAARANLTYIPHSGEDGEAMARKFRRKCIAAGVIKDVKRTAYFVPPSLARRLKVAKACKRFRKDRDASGELLWRLAIEAKRHPQDA